MYKLPQKGIWNQNNRSDKFGNLWSSYNLDLTSSLGCLRVSPRMVLNQNSDTGNLTSLGVPCAFKFLTANSKNIWAIAGGRVFTSAGGANTTFIQDATDGTPTTLGSDYSDIEEFNNYLYFSTGASASNLVYKLDANGAWTNVAIFTSGGTSIFDAHQMVYFKAHDRLYFVDDVGRSVGSINTSDTEATLGQQYSLNDLVLGNEVITWIDASSSYIWIGTMNLAGTSSKIFYWNGSTANTPDGYYIIESPASFSCVIVNDVPVILDSRGRLLQFNGGTFVELDRLPFENDTPTTYKAASTARLCHYNGMELIDGKINILVNTTLYNTNSTNRENVPSGIWEYTKETGLYHKASLGLTNSAGTIIDYGQQKLSAVGALQEIDNFLATTYNGKYIAGATYYTTASATLNGIFYNDSNNTLQSAGCFVTSKIYSGNIDEIWQNIVVRIKRLLTATDKIVVKYRTFDSASTEATITYVNTTSFTVLASAFTTNPVAGDEVEILQGVGAGRTMHITAVSGTTTLTITVDETITGATTQTAKARFQKWKKISSFTKRDEDFLKLPITEGNTSTWIQFKIWVLSTGNNEIDDVIISSKTNEK